MRKDSTGNINILIKSRNPMMGKAIEDFLRSSIAVCFPLTEADRTKIKHVYNSRYLTMKVGGKTCKKVYIDDLQADDVALIVKSGNPRAKALVDALDTLVTRCCWPQRGTVSGSRSHVHIQYAEQ